ncbi:MAG: riboflavin synthase [Planctomycetes bacterium]|nr:riboflavin synthase [Planctomycetota bacterium]
MFTGIVERMCRVLALQRGATWRLTVDLGPLAEGTRQGDSVALNGVCLTVAALDGSRASFDAIGETIGRTNLASLAQGQQVNIERSLRVGDRLGGHFVAGHVDAVGTIRSKEKLPTQTVLRVAVPPELTRFMAAKGSVAVDGVSLTLVDVARDAFAIALIPYTLRETTLGVKGPGDTVNVEVDILARYVARQLGGEELTESALREHGFC